LKYGLSNLVMVIVLLVMVYCWNQWLEWSTIDRILRLAVICVAGLGSYLACLWLMGIRLRDFKHHH
jgi:putative peptidoglycan lipid II flippase